MQMLNVLIIGGLFAIPQGAQCHRPEPVAVPPEQCAERVRVTGDVCREQRTVVLVGGRTPGGVLGHEKTVISAIEPRKPPSTGGSEVSHTTR